MKDFEQRTGVRLENEKSSESSSSFYQPSKKPQPVTLLGMKGPVAVSKRKNVVGAAPIQIAHVGAWSSVDRSTEEIQFKRPLDNEESSETESSEDEEPPCEVSTLPVPGKDCSISESCHTYISESRHTIPESRHTPPSGTSHTPSGDTDQPTHLIEAIKPVQIELRKFTKPTNLRK
ncbi:hypothetical protein PSACC_00536 [Paramicrosporidium saccamoebae]|uniref:Uncharacterized protein n=1 Tax=Paramicrosporidium saccamoebae TaxID=1246581 RepID=A0A2H9TPI8_9FUNG|nr:hypothetical protein PSACC_00536 [Paramicrosporidium saccamoebae]